MTRTVIVVVCGSLVLVACGSRPLEERGTDGGVFDPSGPTLFASHENVCPPPPMEPPPGCTPPTSDPGPGGPEIPVSPYTWTVEGVRLDNSAAGVSGVIADTSTIQLRDGGWRMFVYAGGRYRSATSADGLTFTMDAGARLPEGFGHIRVLRLTDGRIRAYSATGDGIASLVSSDEGMTFTREVGLRLSTSTIGFTPSGVSNIVRTREGTWRCYFSDLPRPGEGMKPHKVLSASSADLLTWMLDAGVRIGEGATLTGNAEHPAAIANADGSVSLFYFRNTNFKMLMATAADGLTFTSEFDSGIPNANDPDLVPIGDGSVRMYFNWGNDTSGAVYSALYVGSPFAAGVAAPVLRLTPGFRD